MSISHKKINQMIDAAVADVNGYGRDLAKFNSLCKKIYLIESSQSDSASAMSIITMLKDEIIHRGSDFKDNK